MVRMRQRQMRISGDVYSPRSFVEYNDAPGTGMDTAAEREAFVARALEEGWRLVASEHSREDWWEAYAMEVEAEEDETGGLFDLSQATRVQPPRVEEDRRILAALQVDPRYLSERFGSEMARHERTVAVNGWVDSQMVTYVFEAGKLVARIPNPEPRTAQGLAVVEGWLMLGSRAGSGVTVIQKRARGWVYCGPLERPKTGAQAGFGAGVAALGDWMAVTGTQPGAVHFYRLQSGEWRWTESVPVDLLSTGQVLAMGDGMVAVGEEYRFGRSGCVEVIVNRDGQWRWEQTVALPDRRLDERLGKNAGFEGESLLAESRRGWWRFPLRRA